MILFSFSEETLALASKIPKGKVSTYKELARALGKPGACRAVGNALNRNPNAPIVPCHRVVKSGGFIGGYALGKKKKSELLMKEGVEVENGRIKGFEGKNFVFD